jgi:hypothetical protein
LDINASIFQRLIFNHRIPGRPTEEVYETVVTAADLPKDIEAIDGLNLCWIGSRTAKSAIVYVCGKDFEDDAKFNDLSSQLP